MRDYASSDPEQQPLTWVNGYALYAAHIIVAAIVVAMIGTEIMRASHQFQTIELLAFQSPMVFSGQVWRVLTYGLINFASVSWAINMVLTVFFGREVERFLGRRAFLGFFAAMYLLAPAVLSLFGLLFPTFRAGAAGCFGVFIAFAALFPGTPLFFTVSAKWCAFILTGVLSIMALGNNDWSGLLTLWTETGFAYAFVRHQQGHFTLPSLRLFKPKPKLRVLPGGAGRGPVAPATPARQSPVTDVDALLDKIARSGIESLTPKERARLDEARDHLRKRDAGRG